MARQKGFDKAPIGIHTFPIVWAELKWHNFAPRLVMYLRIDQPILGANKKPVPFSDDHGAGGFKNEVKSIHRYGMSHPDLVRLRLKETAYVHPFILNNDLYGWGVTHQFKYYRAFLDFIKSHLKLDATQIEPSNAKDWDELLCACLVGDHLESSWAQWFHPAKMPFVGPDGDHMAVVKLQQAA